MTTAIIALLILFAVSVSYFIVQMVKAEEVETPWAKEQQKLIDTASEYSREQQRAEDEKCNGI